MTSVAGRAEVQQVAPKDRTAALELARRIPDGWYRAQSLAILRAMPEGKALAKLARRLGYAAVDMPPEGLQ